MYAPVGPGLAPASTAVRPAGVADLARIARIQHLAARHAYPEALRRAIDAPDRCVLVAELPHLPGRGSGAAIAGWAETRRHERQTDAAPVWHYLAGVTVHPEHRRRGIGLALTAARISWIAACADEAFCVVNVGNRASLDLHRRFGFEEVLRAEVLTGVTFAGGIGVLMRAGLRSGD